MGKAVKKEPIVSLLDQHKNQFRIVIDAADAFENHDSEGQKLLYVALERLFEFGEEIRRDTSAFEEFLDECGKTLNKVTTDNPYNALTDLAFAKRSKSWRSEISNVLRLASKIKGKVPLSQWLAEGGGVSGRYSEAVDYFARPAAKKAQSLRSSRLDMITSELEQSRIVTEALPGVALADGFHRSLLFSQGGQTFLVHVRDEDDQKIIDKYLLEIAGNRKPDDHPLAGRPLYHLFRALDLIVGTCKSSNTGKLQLIAIWNEATDGVSRTKLRFLSDAYSFTNATVTLANALPELEGRGQLTLELSDAETFRQLFQHDCQWRLLVDDEHISVVDDAKSQTRFTLRPIADYTDAGLRQGAKLGQRTRHFQATCAGMKASASNLDMAKALFKRANGAQLAADPTPKRLQWLSNGTTLEAGFTSAQGYSGLSYPFLDFAAPANALDAQMELSLADMAALWKTTSAYGEDLAGYIADSDVADAAFCIDHTFEGGDHFEYVSPMVLGVSMARTQVCEDFIATPVPPPPSPMRPSGPKGGSRSKSPVSGKTAASSTLVASSSTPRLRNFKLIDKNRRAKTSFPAAPSSSGRAFGAFITSCLPDDAEHRADRKFDFEWQLEWWRRMTDIPVHVIASNWTDKEVAASKELTLLSEHGGDITRVGPRILIENRIDCLKRLYASDFDWGIIMDDDAVLMQAESHNSSYRLFAEMAANGKDAYDGVDVFAPIYGRKVPFSKELNAPGSPYANHHVFKKSTDLKGSMIVVRNFEKEGRKPLLPDPSFRTHGEDTYLVLQAVSLGYSSMTSWNMVLEELSGESTFANGDDDRTEKMRKGHELLVEKFGQLGLRMKAGSHSLDKKEFETACWGAKPKRIEVRKPLL
ncbi:hypothetical protein L901_16725 [Agrobacterium sp. D14]|uniref:hypothetical protein n=1 Tax=Agrobacterium TaxID=357 RepID=UPI000745A92B|nr:MULTISPECIES: hypothetical protein [Agrobacterium]KVK54548.1 hypothetical protein L901_16725 [Agrobacterium sp. D14]